MQIEVLTQFIPLNSGASIRTGLYSSHAVTGRMNRTEVMIILNHDACNFKYFMEPVLSAKFGYLFELVDGVCYGFYLALQNSLRIIEATVIKIRPYLF